MTAELSEEWNVRHELGVEFQLFQERFTQQQHRYKQQHILIQQILIQHLLEERDTLDSF